MVVTCTLALTPSVNVRDGGYVTDDGRYKAIIARHLPPPRANGDFRDRYTIAGCLCAADDKISRRSRPRGLIINWGVRIAGNINDLFAYNNVQKCGRFFYGLG